MTESFYIYQSTGCRSRTSHPHTPHLYCYTPHPLSSPLWSYIRPTLPPRECQTASPRFTYRGASPPPRSLFRLQCTRPACLASPAQHPAQSSAAPHTVYRASPPSSSTTKNTPVNAPTPGGHQQQVAICLSRAGQSTSLRPPAPPPRSPHLAGHRKLT